MSVLIEAQNLGRYFGRIKAVDGVSFAVHRGEVLGFLGPNGAGKSTTMKMLTCFLTPTFGTAKVGGFDIVENSIEVRRRIGYLPENAPLYGDMTVLGLLRFVGEVRGMSPAQREEAVERVLNLTTLRDVTAQRVETLSKGFKRRVGLALALLHDPEILILDEPTDGLDPNQKHEVRTLIQSMAATKCILLSTHILEEVDEVCSRVVIIAHGKKLVDDTPEELRKRSKYHGAVTVTLRETTPEIHGVLSQLPGVSEVVARPGEGQARYTLVAKDTTALIAGLVRTAEQRQWTLSSLSTESGQLDEVFREITR